MKLTPPPDDYTKHRTLSFHDRGNEVRVISKPGLADWNRLLPAESLLMESVKLPPAGQLVLIGCHHGALAVHFGSQPGLESRLTAADTNHIALDCTRRSLALNQVSGVEVRHALELGPRQARTVVLLPPRGRAQGRAWLALAAGLLEKGGSLYLAGSNDEGIQSLIKDASALFGSCSPLAYRKGSRAALAIRPETLLSPEWLEFPGMRPGSFLVWELPVDPALTFKIYSLPGVFSYEHLDPGSALMLEHLNALLAELPPQASIVDIGCGYGVLGIAAARKMPAAQVSLLDIDLAALTCARRSLEANDISNAEVIASDLLDACENQRYHLILSNPPFHAGKQVRYDATQSLIAQARRHLLPTGSVVLVANRFIRYDKTLKDHFARVEILAETRQYHLLKARSQ